MSEFPLAPAAFAFVGMFAKKMKRAAAAKAAANIEEYVPESLFAVAGGLVSDLLLTSAALASVGINKKMRWHAAAASAAAPSDRYVHDSLFVNAGVLVSVLLMTPAAFAFVGISVKMLLHAAAALAAAPGDLHVSEFLFAIVGLCHVLALCWNILDWPSRVLGAVMFWNCDIGAALAWSVPGSCKKQSGAFSKEEGYDSFLQAFTLVDPGDFVTIKVWDGHSIDGSPSLGEGQATGRVDVPVGAMELATSFDSVDAALPHRSPQCVVLVNPGSHIVDQGSTHASCVNAAVPDSAPTVAN